MTAITVSLREVVQELEALLEDATLYLDLETGELYQLGDDEAAAVEDGQEDDLPEWLEDDLPRIREIVADERRWLDLPTRFDIHEWAIMDEYAHGQEDADLSGESSRAIHGRGSEPHAAPHPVPDVAPDVVPHRAPPPERHIPPRGSPARGSGGTGRTAAAAAGGGP